MEIEDGMSLGSSSLASIMTENEENCEEDVKGRYHPVRIGHLFSNGMYKVVRQLGWGHFATTWVSVGFHFSCVFLFSLQILYHL
jgi:hypothetical protein